MEGRLVDYTALTESVTRQQVLAFRRTAQKNSAFGPRLTPRQAGIVVGIIAIITLAVLWAFEPVFWPVMQESPTAFFLVGSIPLAVLLGVAIVCVVVLARAFGTNRSWERWLRLDRFAAANDVDFRWQTEVPDLPGYLFSQGFDEVSHDVISGDGWQLGDFTYLTGGSVNLPRSHRWGYVGVRIPRTVPHIVLRGHATARALGGMTLPTLPHTLSLDGDFDRYFSTEYSGDSQDVLEVLSPSVMASLIDRASGYQVEAIDGWLFFYLPGRLVMDNAVTIQRMLRLVELQERVS